MDLLGPFPKSSSGNAYVVTMVDRFTRWPELVAIPDATAETVVDAVIDGLVLRHGCPEKILTDRGSQFTSELFQRMAKRLGVKKVFTTAYHPQTNGQTERFNRVIAEALTSFVDDEQRDWDEYLSSLAFPYRSSVVDSIGETSYYLVHGRDPKLPTSVIFGPKAQLRHDAQQCGLDLTQRLRDSFQAALAVQENADDLRKKRYDQSHVKTDYAEGELVLLFVPQTQPGLARKLQCSASGEGHFRLFRRQRR